MEIRSVLSIIIFSLLIHLNGRAQLISSIFEMGDMFAVNTHKKIDFRSDSIFNKYMISNVGSGDYEVRWPSQCKENLPYRDDYKCNFRINFVGEFLAYDSNSKDSLRINSQYWKNSIRTDHLISIGNVRINKWQKRKIHWLQFYPNYGNSKKIKNYRNLKYLSIPSIPQVHQIQFEKYRQSRHYLTNHGTSDLNAVLKKLKKLEYLDLQSQTYSDEYYLLFRDRKDINFASGLSAQVFELPKLKYLKFSGMTFLPVCLREFEKLNYLHIGDAHDISFPELVNLAAVLTIIIKIRVEEIGQNI